MATPKKPTKAKAQIKVKDLKAKKDLKGGMGQSSSTQMGSGGGKASS